jgi:hypothetical protein
MVVWSPLKALIRVRAPLLAREKYLSVTSLTKALLLNWKSNDSNKIRLCRQGRKTTTRVRAVRLRSKPQIRNNGYS